MDFTTLKSLKPSAYEDAAGGYQAAVAMASRTKDEIENGIAAALRGSLRGEAAEAALRELGQLRKNFHYIQIECGLVSTALRAFAADVLPAKRKLDAAVADAVARAFTVGPGGSVGYPAAGAEVDGRLPKGGAANGTTDETARAVNRQAAGFDPNPNLAYAQDCADRIASAIEEATAVDRKWAPHLRRLEADDDLTVSAADLADAADDMDNLRGAAASYLDDLKAPPKDATPEANAAWWHALTPEEQADYLALFPDRVGAMDGLPSDVRDEANRTVLDERRGRYQLELDAIPPEPADRLRALGPDVVAYSDEWLAWRDKYKDRKEHLEASLKGMDAIQARFDRTGSGLPEAYLLGFDPEANGDGRVILANGNPDTADHTAIYVPGTKSKLSRIGDGDTFGDLGRSERLWATSQSMAPDRRISTITWLDYDAPDDIPHATMSSYSDKGGPTLREFLDGNKTAHEYSTGSSAHTTVIGHSYGSTVVGVATRSGGMLDGSMADDIVVAGSPGMRVDRAADLGLRPGHVWAMGASWDDQVVRQGGRLVGLGDNLTIPTDESFGGNIVESDSTDHSGFWNRNSTSLRNQAAVVTENFEKVELE
ncbi:alpha/beta hydrolase [Streptomyces corynorhini]|uniref:DUF1023 domain-containing protein n=1 Tax=Streptomyces corynorhini TaxID=2282652 RepID=A0A370BGQ7_9ACTN|nr:alpha/beta hydrolase [Streptomyces corynorhini]RDG38983.1 hypothetical protein DVH02_06460 [Streptomyces corynorhini]